MTDYGIHLGDEITAKVNYGMEGGTLLPPEKGRVVYIHPEGRFFTAEFNFAKGSFRESFPLAARIHAPMWDQEPLENGREERLAAFVDAHKAGSLYPNTDFFAWHHRLTLSCEMGRREFAADHNIDVEHGSMTPEDFIRLTEHAYGGKIIQKLRPFYGLPVKS